MKYLLGLLNSNLFFYWLYNKGKRKGEMLELYIRPLSELPVKNVSPQKQNIIIEKVDAILIAKINLKQTTVLERELNALVFKLYEITFKEVKVIDPDFWLSEAEYAAVVIE